MPGTGRRKLFVQVLVIASLLLLHPPLVKCQNAPTAAPPPVTTAVRLPLPFCLPP